MEYYQNTFMPQYGAGRKYKLRSPTEVWRLEDNTYAGVYDSLFFDVPVNTQSASCRVGIDEGGYKHHTWCKNLKDALPSLPEIPVTSQITPPAIPPKPSRVIPKPSTEKKIQPQIIPANTPPQSRLSKEDRITKMWDEEFRNVVIRKNTEHYKCCLQLNKTIVSNNALNSQQKDFVTIVINSIMSVINLYEELYLNTPAAETLIQGDIAKNVNAYSEKYLIPFLKKIGNARSAYYRKLTDKNLPEYDIATPLPVNFIPLPSKEGEAILDNNMCNNTFFPNCFTKIVFQNIMRFALVIEELKKQYVKDIHIEGIQDAIGLINANQPKTTRIGSETTKYLPHIIDKITQPHATQLNATFKKMYGNKRIKLEKKGLFSNLFKSKSSVPKTPETFEITRN